MLKTKKTAKPRPRSERLHQMDSEIVDVAGAAALLGVSKTAIYGLLKKGELPARKIGKEWRFTRKNLLAYVAKRPRRRGRAWMTWLKLSKKTLPNFLT